MRSKWQSVIWKSSLRPPGASTWSVLFIFSFVLRAEAAGRRMISACTLLTRQYSGNDTASRRYCWGCECGNMQKKKQCSVCVRVCVWMSVPAFLSDWWWFLPLDMCWLFTFLKGTKHNATITINYFLNSVLICHFILLESSLLKSSATKWETLINSHVWWSWLKFLVSQCDELNCI